jgi:hypothetical protein
MTYPGTIKNGVSVLVPPVTLPEGTPVRIEVESSGHDFWRTKPVEGLAQEQGMIPIRSLSDLKIDWPDDESVDDLIALVREVRR